MAKLTPMKAIRKKCLECSGGSAKEVRECKAYRSGEKPKGDKYIINISSKAFQKKKPLLQRGL